MSVYSVYSSLNSTSNSSKYQIKCQFTFHLKVRGSSLIGLLILHVRWIGVKVWLILHVGWIGVKVLFPLSLFVYFFLLLIRCGSICFFYMFVSSTYWYSDTDGGYKLHVIWNSKNWTSKNWENHGETKLLMYWFLTKFVGWNLLL